MYDPFPIDLPPVRYFLMEINNESWFVLFRIIIGVILAITALLYFHYRKNPVNSRKRTNEEKG